jgi:hypothetical protein
MNMTEPFILTVIYQGVERNFEARLQILGYTHRFSIQVNGTEVFFEPDEEGEYRARIPPENKQKPAPDIGLLKAIHERLKSVLA